MIDINKPYKDYFRQFAVSDRYDLTREHGYNWYAACAYNDLQGLLEQTDSLVFEWQDGKDEPTFAFIARLKDGTHVVAEGGHDYTGWDCQSSLEVVGIWNTEEEAASYLSADPLAAWQEGR